MDIFFLQFGKENTDDTKFDMESLFSIDDDALREAFKIDESAFSIASKRQKRQDKISMKWKF